jgi:hypothetical protein
MITLLLHLLRLLPFLCGGHRHLALENLALRHQLAVYKRTVTRPRLRRTDRLLWVGLARVWAGWRQALVIVSPNTVLRWQHRRFREHWARLSGRPRVGRPPINAEITALIRTMAAMNLLWGRPENPWRTQEARHRGGRTDRLPANVEAARTPVADLAHVPRQPCPGRHRHRFLGDQASSRHGGAWETTPNWAVVCYPDRAPVREGPGMQCSRCQHENTPTMKFCGECGTPLTANPSSQLAPSYAEITGALSEAREQQTATAEILRIISSSPTDVQPVFETIARNAVRVCDAVYCVVFQVDGDRIDLVAHHNIPLEGLEELRRHYPAPLSVDTTSAQAARERVVVQINDVEGNLGTTEYGRRLAMVVGYRSLAFVPMLREDRALGVIGVSRREAEPFPDQHIALLQTFAAQAVIAIENVRLFNETKEALEQQTATADILRVISSSPTDVQPVFDTIAERAMRLCDAAQGVVATFDGELIHLAALANFDPRGVEAMRETFPLRPNRGFAIGRTILIREVVHLPSLADDPEYTYGGVAQRRHPSGEQVALHQPRYPALTIKEPPECKSLMTNRYPGIAEIGSGGVPFAFDERLS